MNESPMTVLERAIEKNLNADFRHVQLATMDTDGHPACRTIVFRHLEANSGHLYFITDLRSHKVAEIQRQPRVEACWYLPATREQFRLRGSARLVDGNDEAALTQLRADIWERLSPESRRLFTAPPPGTPLAGNPQSPPPAPTAPPACFCLLALTPDGVDHLELTSEPHRRTLYRKSGDQWQRQPLHP